MLGTADLESKRAGATTGDLVDGLGGHDERKLGNSQLTLHIDMRAEEELVIQSGRHRISIRTTP